MKDNDINQMSWAQFMFVFTVPKLIINTITASISCHKANPAAFLSTLRIDYETPEDAE